MIRLDIVPLILNDTYGFIMFRDNATRHFVMTYRYEIGPIPANTWKFSYAADGFSLRADSTRYTYSLASLLLARVVAFQKWAFTFVSIGEIFVVWRRADARLGFCVGKPFYDA